MTADYQSPFGKRFAAPNPSRLMRVDKLFLVLKSSERENVNSRCDMFFKTLTIGGLLGLAMMTGCNDPRAQASAAADSETAVVKGERAYAQTCAACHGVNGQGMPNQGANLKISSFIASRTDDQVVDFVKAGRLPTDPFSTMRLIMPPNGGNPTLSDAQLHQIVTYLRQVQREAGVTQTASASAAK
jgi:mono/diheme cytochrome c family protein